MLRDALQSLRLFNLFMQTYERRAQVVYVLVKKYHVGVM